MLRTTCAIALVFGALVTAQPASAAAVRGVSEIGITVSDMQEALHFYTGVLPFVWVSESELSGPEAEQLFGVSDAVVREARLRLGNETLVLRDWVEPEGRPMPRDTRGHDAWVQSLVLVVRDMDRAYDHLRAHRVQHVSTGPQTYEDSVPEMSGVRAFRFHDPDEHVLEIVWFPPERAAPRWQGVGGALFLGIDHTALVVRDTERSLRFYRDALGFEVQPGVDSYGTAQERLDGVFGARVHVTLLRAPEGPGVRLLEYLAPPGGRALVPSARANDLAHTQTQVVVKDLSRILRGLQGQGARFVSEMPGEPGFLVRDPDGHVVHVVGPVASGTVSR